MDRFRMQAGYCTVTDDTVRIDDSVSGFAKSWFEGNLLLSLFLATVSVWVALSLILDVWIFVRRAALLILVIAILATFVGLAVGALILFGRGMSDTSGDDVISLDAITGVEMYKNREFPTLRINYRKEESDVSRMVALPARRLSFSDEAVQQAESVFEQKEIPVFEK